MMVWGNGNILLPLAASAAIILLCCCQSVPAPALEPYKGDVLVLLMGSPTCGGTRAAMPFLIEYNEARPEGVSLLRLDVPPPGSTTLEPAELPEDFHYGIDRDRAIADRLGFFFYPTLYILDRDGEVRFSGGCDPAEVKEIVSELLAEKPGAPKKMYSPTMPGPGDQAARFEAKTADGKPVSLDELRGRSATLLFFGSATCPYSRKAVEELPGLASKYGPKGTSVVVIDKGGTADSIQSFYREKSPGVPVVVDGDGRISEKDYGVQVVPFFYVLDGNGLVAHRMPFTGEGVRQALESVLGLSRGPVKVNAKGAG